LRAAGSLSRLRPPLGRGADEGRAQVLRAAFRLRLRSIAATAVRPLLGSSRVRAPAAAKRGTPSAT